MGEPRVWIRVLWIWWSVCLLLLLGLWGLALGHSSVSLLAARQLATDLQVRDLAHTLSYLQSMQVELLDALRLESWQGDLSWSRLSRTRSQAEPYCHLYWVRSDPPGTPMLAEDRDSTPGWMVPLIKPRLELGQTLAGGRVVLVRPLPPGAEAGRLTPQQVVLPPLTPANYLLLCAPGPQSTYLISEMSLDYVFGAWLKERATRLGRGSDLAVRFQEDPEATAAPPPLDQVTWLSAWGEVSRSRQWRWVIPALLAEDAHPFGSVEITLDNRAALGDNLKLHLLALAGGGLLMVSFAVSIHLAGLGLRRQLQLTEARSRFTAMVSHELRTPVAAVKMYAEILENQLVDDPAKIASYHRTIGQEAARLGRMVESLLEVGALEKGQRVFKLEELDLNSLARQAAQQRGLPPGQLKLSADLPQARGDREATLQVLDNLIHNAQKYGGDPAQITLVSRPGGQGVAVEVRDRGPGVAPAERSLIFDAYHRVPLGGGGGVGLGLALVKGFMEGQGGSAEVGDDPQGGAVFTIHLPRAGA